MSSRSYLAQLHESGTDFHNSGHIETDFLNEKQMEINCLGMTDSDSSDTEADIINSKISKIDRTDKANAAISSKFKAFGMSRKSASITDIMQSGNDDLVMQVLAESTNREEIFLTDTESDSEVITKLKTSSSASSLSSNTSNLSNSSNSSNASSVISLIGEDKSSDNQETKDDILDTCVEGIMEIDRYFAKEQRDKIIGPYDSTWDSIWDKEYNEDWINKNYDFGGPSVDGISKVNSANSVFASKIYSGPGSVMPKYASYMHLEVDDDKTIQFNLYDFSKELLLIMILHLYMGIYDAMFNIITIDGIISCLIFYLSYLGFQNENNFLSKIRLITIDRYIYYLLMFVGVHAINYITWYQYSEVTRYMASFMICPSIMGQIYNVKGYAKVRRVLYDGYNNLIKKIICKQLSKIINMFIANVLRLKSRVEYTELMEHYEEFDFLMINRFIVTFILALIFNHVDKGSLKIPIMIYKNMYMKDSKYNITNDKLYLTRVIRDRRWEKFLDIYTLNRMIRMLIENDDKDADLSKMINDLLKRTFFRLNRVMFCWTVMSVSGSLTLAVLSFIMFIQNAPKPLRYLLNVAIFSGISLVTSEQLLILILCEICFTVTDSKLISDVTRDTYGSLCRGLSNIYDNTRTESLFLSGLLAILSFFGLHGISISFVIVINMLLFYRFKSCDLNLGRTIKVKPKRNNAKEDIPRVMSMDSILDYIHHMTTNLFADDKNKQSDSTTDAASPTNVINTTRSIVSDYSIHKNSDILRYVVKSIRSNLLYRTIISRTSDKYDLYRMLCYYFSILVFGYISGFATLHMMILPIIIQNIVDIIW